MTPQQIVHQELNVSKSATVMTPQQMIDQLCDELSTMEEAKEQITKQLTRKKRHWDRASKDFKVGFVHRNVNRRRFFVFRSSLPFLEPTNRDEVMFWNYILERWEKAEEDLKLDRESRKLHKTRYKTALRLRRNLEAKMGRAWAQLEIAEKEAEKAPQLGLEEAQSSAEDTGAESTGQQAELDVEDSGEQQHADEEAEPQYEGYYWCTEDEIFRCSDCKHGDLNCQCPGKYGDGLSSADSDSLAESNGEDVDDDSD